MDKLFLSLLNKLDQLEDKVGNEAVILRWGKRLVNGLLIALLVWVVWHARTL